MFSVIELRSQVELWEQYFQDAGLEIENLQGELIWFQVNNSSQEAARQVEHFQNQLLLQEEFISDMFRQLKLSERVLRKKNADATVDENYFSSMKILAEKMDTFQKIYNDFKEEFRQVIKVPM
jgi:hypothetical protein